MTTHGENLVKLQNLSKKHQQVAALLAQGLGRGEIATIIDFTPEYVTWLTRDPLFKQYLFEMSEHTEARFEAMFDQVADVVADGMQNGGIDERLKAARLQLEVTGRIGKNDRPSGAMESSLERLQVLAQRLIALQTNVREKVTINGEVTTVNEE